MGKKKSRAKTKAVPAPTPAAPIAAPEVVENVEAIEIDLDFDDDAPAYNVSRKSPRIHVDEHVEISGFFGNELRQDKLTDASLHGVFVETAHPFEVGDPVVLHLPLEEGKKLRVSGRVRWVTPFGGLKDARPGMGIDFVGLRGEAREALSAMLRRKAR